MSPRSRKRARQALTLGGAALGLAAFVVIATVVGGGGVAPGVEVAGTPLGQDRVSARQAIAERGIQLADRTITLRVGGDVVSTVRPLAIGAIPQAGRAIDEAVRVAPGGLSRSLRAITFRGDIRVPLTVRYRDGGLERWIDGIADQVGRRARNAEVVVNGAGLRLSASRDGVRLREAALRDLFTRDLERLPTVVDLPLERTRPTVTTAELEPVATEARTIVARPADVVLGGVRLRVPASVVARAIRVSDRRVTLSAEVLRPVLKRRFGRFERPSTPARFVVDGERARVVASQDGLAIDADAAALGLLRPARPVAVALTRDPPAFTTARARALGIRDRVGGATTPFRPGLPRVVNISIAARILDGTIVPANATMSLNAILQERTAARGFVPAPMIQGVTEVESVGGGVSQIATTVYNAAFESGLEIVQKTPHSLFISRYPTGRDATISWPKPDLVIRNDWPAAILIQASTGPDSVTVTFYSKRLGRRVESTTGMPTNETRPPTRRIVDERLKKGDRPVDIRPGNAGFSVAVTRRVYRDGRLRRDERIVTRYAPDARVIAVPPGTPGAEKPLRSG